MQCLLVCIMWLLHLFVGVFFFLAWMLMVCTFHSWLGLGEFSLFTQLNLNFSCTPKNEEFYGNKIVYALKPKRFLYGHLI